MNKLTLTQFLNVYFYSFDSQDQPDYWDKIHTKIHIIPGITFFIIIYISWFKYYMKGAEDKKKIYVQRCEYCFALYTVL